MRRKIRKISAIVMTASMLASAWHMSDMVYATPENQEERLTATTSGGGEMFISMDAEGNVTLIPIEDVEAMPVEELEAIDNVQYEVVVEVDGEASVVNTLETQAEAEEHAQVIQEIIDEQPTVEAIAEEIKVQTEVDIEVGTEVEAEEGVEEDANVAKVDVAQPMMRLTAAGTTKPDTENTTASATTTDVTVTVTEVVQEVKNGVVIMSGYIEYLNEDGTTSYTHGSYAPDAAYLGTKGDTYIIMQSGTIGYVKKSSAYIVEYDTLVAEGKIVATYTTSNGKLYHNITTNNKSVASTYIVGYQQDYMDDKATYYSYDGHYFYKDYKTMVTDYKKNTFANAINAKKPYYSYYQYLSHRTKTSFTAEQINAYIDYKLGAGSNSVLVGTGQDFIDNQNIYGTNAVLMFGVAVNESGWGKSSISLTKNNLFGHGAVDSDAANSAYTYKSISDCIAYHAETFLSKGYANPKNWKYNGAHLGNKDGGANVKYASDPYWGEKAAAQGYLIENYFSKDFYDYNSYQIGMSSEKVNAYSKPGGTIVYNTLSGSSKIVENLPFVILEKTTYNGETWYKVQSDGVLNSTRTAVNSTTGVYDFKRDYVYVKASQITVVNEVDETIKPQEPEEPDEPDETFMRGDVSGDGKIDALDYIKIKNHITGSKMLNDKEFKAADTSGDGKIDALDYIKIKNHITGEKLLV